MQQTTPPLTPARSEKDQAKDRDSKDHIRSDDEWSEDEEVGFPSREGSGGEGTSVPKQKLGSKEEWKNRMDSINQINSW